MGRLEDMLAANPPKPRTTVKRFALDLKARIARAAHGFELGDSRDCATGLRHALGVIDAALSDYDVRDPEDYLGRTPSAALPSEPTGAPLSGVRSLTRNMLEMMSHALGQSRGGRNYYCVGVKDADAADWRWLVEQGYATAGRLINDDRDAIFHVTAKGMAVVLNGPAAPPQEGKREPTGPSGILPCLTCGSVMFCRCDPEGKREPGEKP